MGDRANYAVVRGGQHQLWYSHWSATTVPTDMFWGPDHALAFMGRQRAMEWADWLDEVWCEGGAVLDFDRKVLWLFGGEDIRYDVQLRRRYMHWLPRMWPGWTVEWAFEGITDLARAVGVDVGLVLDSEKPAGGGIIATKAYVDTVVSVVRPTGELQLFEAQGWRSALAGPIATLEVIGAMKPRTTHAMEKFPRAGLHIDEGDRSYAYWGALTLPNGRARIQAKAPGWKIEPLGDDYLRHLDLTRGALSLPERSAPELDASLVKVLLQEVTWTPTSLVEGMERHGKKIEVVNPYFFEHAPLELTPAARREMLRGLGLQVG